MFQKKNEMREYLYSELEEGQIFFKINENGTKEIIVSFTTEKKEGWGRNFDDELTATLTFSKASKKEENKPVEEFHELCLPYYTDVNPNYDLFEISKSLQNRVEKLEDIPSMIDFINNALTFDETIYTHKKMKTK